MTILDKLMEKKDLNIYIQLRSKEIKAHKKRIPKLIEPKKRQIGMERACGRENELKRLKVLIKEGTLKKECHRLWTDKALGKFHEDYDKNKELVSWCNEE